jgi:uncharacterized small protein (DUF1192 family)
MKGRIMSTTEAPETEHSVTVPPEGERAPAGTTLAKLIYDDVERQVAQGGVTKERAFADIALATGRAQRTVAANYYRYAREQGVVKPRVGSPMRVSQAQAGSVVAAAELALRRVNKMTEDLAELQAEIEMLRANAEASDEAVSQLKKLQALLVPSA